MIQILGYREYFNKNKQIWDVKHVLTDVSAESIPDLFANAEKYLERIPKNERFNLHYTLADCYEAPRLFKSQTTIPFDLDDIDTERLSDYISLMVRELNVPFNEMGITFSGHGLHFLVETDYSIQSEEELKSLQSSYKLLCGRIDGKIKSSGLPGHTDSGIFRPSGTLRFPGSENRAFHKRDEKLPHKLFPSVNSYAINSTMVVQQFKLLEIVPGDLKERDNVSPQELRQFPRPDTEFLLKECNFLNWNFEKPHEVLEPQWYAALSIVGVLPNGRDIAHTMSKGHPSYDYGQTDIKLEQAMESSGPRTCVNIDTLSDKCRSCKYFGQITSPILLRGPDYIKTLDTGFWHLEIDSKGKPKPSKPAYEDLRRFFEKSHKYISTPSGTIFVWKETKWEEMEDIFISAFVQNNMNPKPSKAHVAEFMALIKRTNVRPENFFDASTIGRINLSNGVLKLDSMELEPHDPKFGFKYCLDHAFDPAATCPRFDIFMKEITCNRQELSDILLEYAAYAFSGMPYIYHKALMMSGEGSNGKSTFIAVLKKLAGTDSYSSLMLNELDHEYKRAYMVGKLFNVAEETPVRSLGDSSWFKVLSAGGSYMAREIYKKPTNVVSNRTKLIMACNELPDMTDFSDGFIRRLIICPFDAKFTNSEDNKGEAIADTRLEDKLSTELSGIFNRIIEAYHRLQAQNGFTSSKLVKQTIQTYMDSQNTVFNWFNEEVEYDYQNESWVVPASHMYRIYVDWCKPMSIKPVTTTKFGLEVGRLTAKSNKNARSFIKKIEGKPIRVWGGVKLLTNQNKDF